ncbi:hypothetical protein DL762_005897 [Monosporascus cannonballus]|uniref:3-keto-disaccharide hydrolase domain-containing protein n=1 Tax=Monosporascus cannonballus TaxID=155416 RepID=A0ABY0H3J0_9PEZI|nr:hypothetical protein DL762_005897 [Monosporascus cannonballus]
MGTSSTPLNVRSDLRFTTGVNFGRQSLKQTVVGLLLAKMAGTFPTAPRAVLDYTTAEAGNPFVEGWYADPDTEYYNNLYWIYPTYSDVYEKQTYMDAFSSPDLINWTKHPNILVAANVSWAYKAMWAPAAISRNGKCYLYFGANDIQVNEIAAGFVGGIGVAIADKPEGPYVDAIGEPLIGDFYNGAQPIDQDVFVDDDGQAYIYYGGHSHANVAKLNDDMVSLGTFGDGTTFKEITPENYVEGSQMFKRKGIYYFMWSEGGWMGPDYSVSYAMSDSPLGPFKRIAKILQQDGAVARGSGHNGVINVPGTDVWYITYHRRPLSETDGNHRVICYDRMYFNDDDTIKNITMLVKDNFADGNMIGWITYGDAEWRVVDQRLALSTANDGHWRLATLDTNFADFVYDGLVTVVAGAGPTGLVFRATDKTAEGYGSYYAATIEVGKQESRLTLSSVSNGRTSNVESINGPFVSGIEYHIRVTALGSDIRVFVDNLEDPDITVQDTAHTIGASGVVVGPGTSARFGGISIAHPPS